MNYKRWFIIFGILDLLIIFNFLIFPFLQGYGFLFYQNSLSSMESSAVFFDDQPHMAWIFLVPHLLTATVLISAPLLLLQRRLGAYISLFQSLFRILGLMMPTFFFVSYLSGALGSIIPAVVLGLTLEAVKIYILFNIIRGNNNYLVKNRV